MDDWTDLGECKWGRVRSLRSLRDELASKVVHYPNSRGATVGRRLFVRKKPRPTRTDDRNVRVHDLEDLYRAP